MQTEGNLIPYLRPCRDFVTIIMIMQELLKPYSHRCAISTGWSPNIEQLLAS